jgi:hypothetical protein
VSSAADYHPDDAVQADLAAWVDEVADQFEAAWQSLRPPRIADYLAGADCPRREAVLVELVKLDAAYRRRLGEKRQVEDYWAEFPELRGPGLAENPATGREPGPSTPCPVSNTPSLPHGESDPVAGNAVKISGYELLGELGRGGMGVLYKARQVNLNRIVALKMILAGPAAGPEQRARFRAEGEAAAQLQHPHIVSIYEVGEQHGRAYCAMEYVDGGTLTQRLAGSPLSPRLAAQFVETLARAVDFAHAHGIVHRDLKPANILLQRKSENPNSKSEKRDLSDLGFRIFPRR